MTIQKSIEDINQIFPMVRGAQIIADLDKAQKDFVDETFYLETYYSLNNISSNTTWLLPTFFNSLKEVLFYDSNGNPLYKEDFKIDYEIEFGNLYFKSTTAEPLVNIPAGISYILIGFYQKPFSLTSIADSFSVNDEHIDGIVAKVYAKYYSRFSVDVTTRTGELIKTRDFNAVRYWEGKAQEYRIKAKRWVNKKNDVNTDGSVINYGMGGIFQLPLKKMPVIGGSLSPISILQQLYSKYFKFTATNGIYTISPLSFGWTTLPTISYANNIFTISSANNEFTNTMISESNNRDYHVYVWVTGEIALQFQDASGTLIVTIAELL